MLRPIYLNLLFLLFVFFTLILHVYRKRELIIVIYSNALLAFVFCCEVLIKFSFKFIFKKSTESRNTLEQKIIFEIGTLNPHGINERFSFN